LATSACSVGGQGRSWAGISKANAAPIRRDAGLLVLLGIEQRGAPFALARRLDRRRRARRARLSAPEARAERGGFERLRDFDGETRLGRRGPRRLGLAVAEISCLDAPVGAEHLLRESARLVPGREQAQSPAGTRYGAARRKLGESHEVPHRDHQTEGASVTQCEDRSIPDGDLSCGQPALVVENPRARNRCGGGGQASRAARCGVGRPRRPRELRRGDGTAAIPVRRRRC